MIRRIAIIFIVLFSLVFVGRASAVGTETVNYKLYFNWKFIWITAGTASMSTTVTEYRGKPAYRTSLVTSTSKRIDRYFMMRDTIASIFAPNLTPYYYRKGAREGKRYYVDEMWYSYPKGEPEGAFSLADKNHCQTTTRHIHADNTKTVEKHYYMQPVTDMLHAFQWVRGMDPIGWKPGHIVRLSIAGGSEVTKAKLVYRGMKVIKGEDKKKYNCLVLSYIEPDGNEDKEIVRFFVTNDARHIPVRLDLFLRFGSAKAFLTSVN